MIRNQKVLRPAQNNKIRKIVLGINKPHGSFNCVVLFFFRKNEV